MSANRTRDYLAHMREAAQLACAYVEGMDKPTFLQDKRTQQAVILNIVVIGEAATKIVRDNPEFAESHAHFPWKSMKGMRNRIAHGYFDINLDIVWDTLHTDLPALAAQIDAIDETT